MDDLLPDFLTESYEGLAQIDNDLVSLEKNPENTEILGGIFRTMHTIKGTCGFLGLSRLEHLAHSAENVLGKMRDGDIKGTPEIISLILASVDSVKDILSYLEANGTEPEGNDKDLIEQLEQVCESDQLSGGFAEDQITPPVEDRNEEQEKAITCEFKPTTETSTASESKKTSESAIASQSIRVNVELLENLMTTVSELVLTRNQLLQMVRGVENTEIAVPLQRLNQITSALQEGVMKTRMQPVGNAWAKLPRLIRDLGRDLSKKIDLVMNGEDTELDRQVLELIKDPLTHMVRNSADHGLESGQTRIAAGKSETGTVTLNAYHAGGHIIIEISDDGAGLNTERIKEKALANGLATESELESMSEGQIHQFIFKAGFSTATTVTNVSGRGVGMDVVRTNIESIGGTIEVHSMTGKGTTFSIKIPLTLAIVSALIVESAGERFAVPQLSVLELVRVSEHSELTIEYVNGVPVMRLRNHLLPLISLQKLLKLPDRQYQTEFTEKNETSSLISENEDLQISGSVSEHIFDDAKKLSSKIEQGTYVIVTQVGAQVFGIMVDQVFDTQEIVIKPVSPIVRTVNMFTGNTILGDGSVVMILDPNSVATEIGEMRLSERMTGKSGDEDTSALSEKVSFILFKTSDHSPKAVPLALLSRLEEIALSSVEYSNGQAVVQYRGQLMPLISLDGPHNFDGEGQCTVLVFADEGRYVGVVVNEIIDILEEEIDIKISGSTKGLFGTAVFRDKATDLVDVDYFISRHFPDWGKKVCNENNQTDNLKVLYIDPCNFSQSLITPVLRMEGYQVFSFEDPEKALDKLSHDSSFVGVIVGVDKTCFDPYEFSKQVRNAFGDSAVGIAGLVTNGDDFSEFQAASDVFDSTFNKHDRTSLVNFLQDVSRKQRSVAA